MTEEDTEPQGQAASDNAPQVGGSAYSLLKTQDVLDDMSLVGAHTAVKHDDDPQKNTEKIFTERSALIQHIRSISKSSSLPEVERLIAQNLSVGSDVLNQVKSEGLYAYETDEQKEEAIKEHHQNLMGGGGMLAGLLGASDKDDKDCPSHEVKSIINGLSGLVFSAENLGKGASAFVEEKTSGLPGQSRERDDFLPPFA